MNERSRARKPRSRKAPKPARTHPRLASRWHRVPGGQEPTFNYLAVQVSTSFASSDVTIERTHARRVVSVHRLIAFAFNTIIVALLVSVLVNVAV